MGPEEQVNDFFPADGETMSEQVVRWVAQVCGRSLGEGEEARPLRRQLSLRLS